ncbi:hypothetical protein FEM03_05445 [Phragmitibacter flavus]|uniref:Protein kinase domain-containing protein n=1 Tax=Phragmitibacter flavus TaxID=2576071 RepID=A0A5R8KH02_9BACT|nr:WD40 repeat domain-containing serine/threonine protein kinase [Phragmitibacter flavus]TLD71588.1 hypothetical protein FEM03_05445 [Phragmitibacter flavus]
MSTDRQTSQSVCCSRCGTPLPQAHPRLVCAACLLKATSLSGQHRIGPYVIDSPLGEGGMGEVFLAFHENTLRAVALKIPSVSSGSQRASLIKRFAQEARLLSLLDHPGILPIYEVGDDPEQPWFAMKLAEGGTLADLLQQSGALEPREAAQILLTISSAVQYAHDHGILHRDLKPQNILLDEKNVPMLGDFGLARADDRNPNFSRSLAALGTPGYSAPEVAQGRAPSAAADIFSLGAILYHLLAGEPPFKSDTLTTTLELAQLGKAEPLTRRGISLDLWRITRKCLEPEPADRYPTAAALEQDLNAWLQGRSVSVRRLTPLTRLSRLIRRNPLATALILTTALAVIISLSFILVSQQQFEQARQIRTTAEHQLSTQRRHLERLDHIRLLLDTRRAGNRREALSLLREEWQSHPGETLRSLVLRAFALADLTVDGPLPAHNSAAYTLSSPAKSHTSPASHRKAVVSDQSRRVQIFNQDGQLEATLELQDRATALQWNPSGDRLALGCSAKNTYLWEAGQTFLQPHVRGRDSATQSFTWHPQERHIACLTDEGSLHLWDLERRQDLVMGDFYIPAGQTLTWDSDGQGLTWKNADGTSRHAKVTFPTGVRLLFSDSPSGRRETFPTIDLDAERGLVVWITEQGAHLWDFQQSSSQLLVPKTGTEWLGAQLTATGLQTCGWNSGLRSLNFDQLRSRQTPPVDLTQQQYIGKVLFSATPTNPPLLALLESPQHRFVLSQTGPKPRMLNLPQKNPYSIALTNDGTHAATSSFQKPGVRLWTLKPTPAPLYDLPVDEHASSLTISPDGRTLATVSRRNTTLWDIASGRPLRNIDNHEPASLGAWSPDSKLLAVLNQTGAMIYRVRDGHLLAQLATPAPQPGTHYTAITFDKKQPVLGMQLEDGSIILWDLKEMTSQLHSIGIDWPVD